MADVAEIAARTAGTARQALLYPWPLHARWLTRSHRRWFHRHRLIEDHSETHYRLTPLGLAVRKHLLETQNA